MPSASRPRRIPRLRRLPALAVDNWLARGYLASFAASVLVVLLFPDSGFAPGPLMLTAPLSFLSVILPFGPGTEGSGAVEVFTVGFRTVWLLLCALVNAAVLGALVARFATTAPAGAREPLPRIAAPSERGRTDRARSARHRLQGVRALLAPAVDNWLARGYLAVVAAALGFFLYAVYLSPGPGFAGIWPLMATAPLGFLASLVAAPAEHSSLAWLSPLIFSAGAVLSGLVNAVLLGLLARGLRAREAHQAAWGTPDTSRRPHLNGP
ncbi:SCO4225 family membrane protein [Streptomyces desertarenae]|uniref:SCO4225 family membrane protein n=1 Tax=Streptomyces desertarenae TaxID=2666184 RepID=A0ABW4PCY0_9ACTN